MKTQKIFLLAVMLMLALALVACGPASYEAEEYFVFEDEAVYTTVKDFDGEPISYNADYNVIALATERRTSLGEISRRIAVYDLTTEKVVYEYSSNLVDGIGATASVNLDKYPVVTLSYQYRNGTDDYDRPLYETRYSYYLLDEHGGYQQIEWGLEYDNIKVDEVGNMFVVRTEEKIWWVNKDLKVVRTAPAPVSDSYVGGNLEYYFGFKAEYENYLYAWEFKQESQMIVVYNPNGVASAKYTFTPGTAYTDGTSLIDPTICVLENGCVLVQECVIVSDGGEYDFEYLDTKFKLVTSVMNYKTGEIKKLDCNFVIKSLESAYSRPQKESLSDFPFGVKAGTNQAYIVRFGNGRLAMTTEYVVLSNALEVKYTLPNKYLAKQSTYNTIKDVNENGYYANATINGVSGVHFFNFDGELVYTQPTNFVDATDSLYFTNNGIYSFDGKLLYDIAASEFAGNKSFKVETLGDKVIIKKYNYETKFVET